MNYTNIFFYDFELLIHIIMILFGISRVDGRVMLRISYDLAKMIACIVSIYHFFCAYYFLNIFLLIFHYLNSSENFSNSKKYVTFFSRAPLFATLK